MGSGGKSLFSGGSRSIASQLAREERQLELPLIDISQKALDDREAARTKLPVVPLRGDISVVDRRVKSTLHYDLSDLAARFPAHAPLILQLLAGALPQAAGRSPNTAKHYLHAITEFVEFLNAPENLSNTPVALVGDITVTVCRAFSQRLLQRYPERVDIRKIYGALRKAVQKLQTTHAGQPGIGKSFDWPKGPVRKGNHKDGYTPEAFIELSEACVKDIREVMRLHDVYDRAIREGNMILLEEWNLPNLMFYLAENVKARQSRPIGEILGRILQNCPNACRFMEEHSLTKSGVVNLYLEKGVELASLGVMPGQIFTPVDANQKITIRQAAEIIGIPYRTFIKRHTAPGCLDPVPVEQGGYHRTLVSIGDLQKHYPHATLTPKQNDWNSLPNFMHWLHWHATQGGIRFRSSRDTISRHLKLPACQTWMKANSYSVEDIILLYETRGTELAQSGRSPFAQSFPVSATPEEFEDRLKRIVATLAIQFPNYPYNMDYKGAREFISDKIYRESQTDWKATIHGRINYFAQKLTNAPFLRSDNPSRKGNEICGANFLYATLHFLPETLYPFLLLILIQTGWNLESVLAIADGVDSYVTDDLLDTDNYVRICSTKVRGQKGGEKVVSRRCNRHNKYGTYRLLKYVESVVTRYRNQQNYIPGSLWQYTVRAHAFAKSLVNAFGPNGTNNSTLNEASRMFVERHAWKHFGEQNIDHPRIRVTYETMREMQGLPLSARAMDLDHADQETTDVHYASDTTSHAQQDRRIGQYQEQLVDDIMHYQCRIVESVSLQSLRDGIHASHAERKKMVATVTEKLGVDENQIVHLLSPEAQTYIAVCNDATQPTWPGHDLYLKSGQNCSFFNKCALCKQAVIFSEALPYIARRIIVLDEMRDSMNQMEWLGSFGEEWDAWHQVLADWSDRDQVAQAQAAAESGQVELPILMRGAR